MKIESSTCGQNVFNLVRRLIFDDFEVVYGGHYKHDESFVTLISEVDGEWEQHILASLKAKGYKLPDGISLVGHWMVETTLSERDGVIWYSTTELIKCQQVTETKIVTSWKPI